MDKKYLLDQEDIDALNLIEFQLNKCSHVSTSRPYEYEHNHFELTEMLARFITDDFQRIISKVLERCDG